MISGSLALSGALLEDAFHDAEGSRDVSHPLLPLRVTFFFLSIFPLSFALSSSFFSSFARLSVSRGDDYAFFPSFFLSFLYDRYLRFILKVSLPILFVIQSLLPPLFYSSSIFYFTLFSIVNYIILLFVDSRELRIL